MQIPEDSSKKNPDFPRNNPQRIRELEIDPSRRERNDPERRKSEDEEE